MHTNDRAKEISLVILNEVFATYPARDFAVRLWDGTVWPQGHGSSPRFTLVHHGLYRARE
jgi:hypothetical protein